MLTTENCEREPTGGADKLDELKLGGIFSKGYGIIPKLVMKDKNLTVEAKSIYAYICSYAGGGDTAFPSVDMICSDLGMSENRFFKHRKLLVESGYLTIKRTRKEVGWSNNIYTICHTVHLQFEGIGIEGIRNEGTNNNNLNNNSSNNKKSAKNTRNSAKAKYDEVSPYILLSKDLFNRIKRNNDEAKEPNYQTWADDFRKLIELDGKSVDNVRLVIEWCQQDSFWKANILSAKKLRDKYDQLKVQSGKFLNPGNQTTVTDEEMGGNDKYQQYLERKGLAAANNQQPTA